MSAEIFKALIAVNLAAGGAILLLLLTGPALRRTFGARLAYAAWLAVPIAALAALLPVRAAKSLPIAPAPVRPLAEMTVQVLAMDGPAFDWAQPLVAVWALGALALIALTVWTQVRTLGLIGRLTADGRIVRSANPAIGPAVLGILRPRIMLPADFERRFDATEQAVIMAHEERHIAGHDARINAAVELIRCLFWFNPFIHLAARRVRIDQELACDEAVIARYPKARRAYAEALLKTQTASAPLPLGCYWPQRSHRALKERLTMLTLKPPGRARSFAGCAVIASLGLGAGYAAWAAAPAAPEPADVLAPIVALAPTAMSRPEPPSPAPALTNSRPAEAIGRAAPLPPGEADEDILITARFKAPPNTTEGEHFRIRSLPLSTIELPIPDGPEKDALLAQMRETAARGESFWMNCRRAEPGASPVCSIIPGEAPVGLRLPPGGDGQALRTFTIRRRQQGAPLPEGAELYDGLRGIPERIAP